jgi:RNA polymerase sigma factor (sigma-70 family)
MAAAARGVQYQVVMAFPLTRRSVVQAAGSADPEVRHRGFEALVAAYWRPVYKYLRLKWGASREDAEDLTQGFFARALEKGFFDRFDPARARFRTYLRTCLDGYVANERKSSRRLKRGGGAEHVSLDFGAAETELAGKRPPRDADMEAYFHREWVRSVFGLAVEALRRRCAETGKERSFALFERYDLDGPDAPARPTYGELALELGLAETQVTNQLAWARREFRRLVLEALEEATGSEEEFRAEARQLLGVDPP